MDRETSAKLQWAGLGLVALATWGAIYACNSRASDDIYNARQNRYNVERSVVEDMLHNENSTESLK